MGEGVSMVHLEQDKLQGNINTTSKKLHNNKSPEGKNKNSEVESFSLFVLDSMVDENIPPTPNNFQIYFEKLLENKPLSFRKRINEYLEVDDDEANEDRAKMEREIKEGFVQIKGMVKVVSTVYKNLNILKQIVKKRSSELKINFSQLSIENTLSTLNNDLDKLTTLTAKQMEALKGYYDKTLEILKDVDEKAIFDLRYGVYNKKHFLNSLKKESDAIRQYNHKSSIVMVNIKDEVLDKIATTKEKEMLTKNIAKLLMKTSRRSDVVAHYGSGIFAILMKHTDLSSAQKACERIAELIYGTSFFIDETEIKIDIGLGIMPINPNYSIEEAIDGALDMLPKTGKDKEIYLVGKFIGDE